MTSRTSLIGLLTVSWALACGGSAPVELPTVPDVQPEIAPPPPEEPPEPIARPARRASDVVVPDLDVRPIPEPPPIPTLEALPKEPEPRAFVTPSGTATITTPPSNPDAAKVVARFAGQLRACYEVELVNNPTASGALVLAFTVDGGRVTASSIQSAETKPSAAFESCLLGRAKRWSFPLEVAGEQTVGVSFSTQGT